MLCPLPSLARRPRLPCVPPQQTVLSILDRKGDTLNYPKAVTMLPFSETADTSLADDDYAVTCGPADSDPGDSPVSGRQRISACPRCRPSLRWQSWSGAAPPHRARPASQQQAFCLAEGSGVGGRPPRLRTSLVWQPRRAQPWLAIPPPPPLQDLVYYFKPAADCTVTASLCGSSALADTLDSRLYLLADVDHGGALRAAACSNDACGVLPSLTVGPTGRAAAPGRQAALLRLTGCGACCAGLPRPAQGAHPPGSSCPHDQPSAGAPTCAKRIPRPRPQASLKAGVGYAFVVDGVGGASGRFRIRQGHRWAGPASGSPGCAAKYSRPRRTPSTSKGRCG